MTTSSLRVATRSPLRDHVDGGWEFLGGDRAGPGNANRSSRPAKRAAGQSPRPGETGRPHRQPAGQAGRRTKRAAGHTDSRAGQLGSFLQRLGSTSAKKRMLLFRADGVALVMHAMHSVGLDLAGVVLDLAGVVLPWLVVLEANVACANLPVGTAGHIWPGEKQALSCLGTRHAKGI